MGVPGFIGWLKRRVRANFDHSTPLKGCRNVYFDLNSLIHPCCHDDSGTLVRTEEEMFKAVVAELENVMAVAKPSHLVYLAVDGVAPAAKLQQQRDRRLRSAMETDEFIELEERLRELKTGLGEPVPARSVFTANAWDSNQITPGTDFMQRLSEHLREYVAAQLREDAPMWRGLNVIFSDAGVRGEGEHKILDFIRSQDDTLPLKELTLRDPAPSPQPPKPQPGRKAGDAKPPPRPPAGPRTYLHCIVGDDTDLIMLGLGLHRERVCVLRDSGRLDKLISKLKKRGMGEPASLEVDEAGADADGSGSGSGKGQAAGRPTKSKYSAADIDKLRHILRYKEFKYNKMSSKEFERVVIDMVVLFFLGGNDFVPHLPTVDIRDGSLGFLLQSYKQTLLARKPASSKAGSAGKGAERERERVSAKGKGWGHRNLVREDYSLDLGALSTVLEDFAARQEHGVDEDAGGKPILHPGQWKTKRLPESDWAWSPPSTMVLCKEPKDEAGRCFRGNRCRFVHEDLYMTPFEYSLGRIRAAVVGFALQASAEFLDPELDAEALARARALGPPGFELDGGAQSARVDEGPGGELRMQMQGLSKVEKKHVAVLCKQLGLESPDSVEEEPAEAEAEAEAEVEAEAEAEREAAEVEETFAETVARLSEPAKEGEPEGGLERERERERERELQRLRESEQRGRGARTLQKGRGRSPGRGRPGDVPDSGSFKLVVRPTCKHPAGPSREWALRVLALARKAYEEEVDNFIGMDLDRTAQAALQEQAAVFGPDRRLMKPSVYYAEKMGVAPRTPLGEEMVRDMSTAYVRGLQFVTKYYFQGLPSWEYKYPFHYAPLARDLGRVCRSLGRSDYDRWPATQPVTPVQQLMAVLPARSSAHVPESCRGLMLEADSPVAHLFPPGDAIALDPNGRRFKWQWISLLPQMEPALLADHVDRTRERWTPDEEVRDRNGTPLLYSTDERLRQRVAASVADGVADGAGGIGFGEKGAKGAKGGKGGMGSSQEEAFRRAGGKGALLATQDFGFAAVLTRPASDVSFEMTHAPPVPRRTRAMRQPGGGPKPTLKPKGKGATATATATAPTTATAHLQRPPRPASAVPGSVAAPKARGFATLLSLARRLPK